MGNLIELEKGMGEIAWLKNFGDYEIVELLLYLQLWRVKRVSELLAMAT